MKMLRFMIEWEDEPRVQDRLLRATWARLEIHALDGSRKFCFTDCLGGASHSLRRGVYGSVYPVANWVVENWWSLLGESIRTEHFRGGRALANDPLLTPWVRRHTLLAARGGFALPDLTFYRDGARIAVRCLPDPFDLETPYPVRFVCDTELRLSLATPRMVCGHSSNQSPTACENSLRMSRRLGSCLRIGKQCGNPRAPNRASARRLRPWVLIPTTPGN